MVTNTYETPVTLDELRDWIKDQLSDTYELVYVDYRDQLTDEQTKFFLDNDFEALWDSLNEWESEARWSSVEYILKEKLDDAFRHFEVEGRDASHFNIDFEGSEQWQELCELIGDRDRSDWFTQLLNQTPRVMFRVTVRDEDECYSYEVVTPEQLLDDIGFEHTAENLSNAADIVDNAATEYGCGFVMAIWAGDLSEIDKMRREGATHVTITNPHIWLGNPLMGDGYCEKLTGDLTVKLEDVQRDGAHGYSWNDVAGIVQSYYEADMVGSVATSVEA